MYQPEMQCCGTPLILSPVDREIWYLQRGQNKVALIMSWPYEQDLSSTLMIVLGLWLLQSY